MLRTLIIFKYRFALGKNASFEIIPIFDCYEVRSSIVEAAFFVRQLGWRIFNLEE